jgi:hypothetical protein
MPESLRQFVPAYAATRIIGEVLIEALPQCIMQAVILVMVSSHVRAGTASQTELNLMAVNDGSFVNVLPKSIGISTLTMLKTWYELVQEAREALLNDHSDGWHGHAKVEDAYEPFVKARLDALGDVDADEYFLPSSRWDALEVVVAAVREPAAARGVTPAQLALAWLLHQGVVCIPGTTSRARFDENLGAHGVALSADELALLDARLPVGAAAGGAERGPAPAQVSMETVRKPAQDPAAVRPMTKMSTSRNRSPEPLRSPRRKARGSPSCSSKTARSARQRSASARMASSHQSSSTV